MKLMEFLAEMRALLCCAGDSDDAYYSPKSNASFSDGSFTSTQEVFGRSASEDLDASFSGDFGRCAFPPGLEACHCLFPKHDDCLLMVHNVVSHR